MKLLSVSGIALGRRTGICASTGEPLEPGADVVTVLVEADDGEGFERLDFSADAWDAGARPPEGRAEFAFWRGVQPASGAKPQGRLVSDDELLELFGRTSSAGLEEGDEDPRQLTFRYVLALLLIRRRMLTVMSTSQQDGAVVMKVRVRGRPDEVLEVLDPGLDDTALEAETQALIEMLVPEADEQAAPADDAGGAPQADEEGGG